MTQLRLYKKDAGDFGQIIKEMDYLKEMGLINEWSLVEENSLISYTGKYKNVCYGGKIKIKDYREVKKHIDETINHYSWGGGLWL